MIMLSDFLESEGEWRVLICGGRDYGETFAQKKKAYDTMGNLVEAALSADRTLVIIHGAARGADSLADETSNFFGIKAIAFPANWDRHGKRAGSIRNEQMLREGRPHLVVAFPGGSGTAHMCRIAEEAGVPVRKIKS